MGIDICKGERAKDKQGQCSLKCGKLLQQQWEANTDLRLRTFFASPVLSLESHMSTCQGLSPRILYEQGFQTFWTMTLRKKHILCCDTEHTHIYQTAKDKLITCSQHPYKGQDFHYCHLQKGKNEARRAQWLGLSHTAVCGRVGVQLQMVWLQSLGSEPQTKAKISQWILIFLCEIQAGIFLSTLILMLNPS